VAVATAASYDENAVFWHRETEVRYGGKPSKWIQRTGTVRSVRPKTSPPTFPAAAMAQSLHAVLTPPDRQHRRPKKGLAGRAHRRHAPNRCMRLPLQP
jgi:hypothetical protein